MVGTESREKVQKPRPGEDPEEQGGALRDPQQGQEAEKWQAGEQVSRTGRRRIHCSAGSVSLQG